MSLMAKICLTHKGRLADRKVRYNPPMLSLDKYGNWSGSVSIGIRELAQPANISRTNVKVDFGFRCIYIQRTQLP